MLAALLTMGGAAPGARGQTYSIDFHAVSCGGHTFAPAGSITLSGIFGEPIGGTMTDGNYVLTSGFWSIALTFPDPCLPCDTNCDGSVNPFDINSFLDLLAPLPTPCSPCAGDTNENGTTNPFDIQGFIECLAG